MNTMNNERREGERPDLGQKDQTRQQGEFRSGADKERREGETRTAGEQDRQNVTTQR